MKKNGGRERDWYGVGGETRSFLKGGIRIFLGKHLRGRGKHTKIKGALKREEDARGQGAKSIL